MAARRLPPVSSSGDPGFDRDANLAVAFLPDRRQPAAVSPSVADFAIVPAPAALALDGEVEGLDARHVLPPLLRPEMLTDRRLRRVGATGGRRARHRRSCRPNSARARIGIDYPAPPIVAARTPEPARDGRARVRRCVRGKTGQRSGREGPLTRRRRAGPRGRGSALDPARSAATVAGRRLRCHLAARRAVVARCGRRVAGLSCRATVWKLDRILRSGPAFDRGVPAGRAGRREDGSGEDRSRAAPHAETPSSPWQTATAAIRNADLLLVHLSDPKTLAGLLGRIARHSIIGARTVPALLRDQHAIRRRSSSCPSTPGQLTLLRILVNELTAVGADRCQHGRARLRDGDDPSRRPPSCTCR